MDNLEKCFVGIYLIFRFSLGVIAALVGMAYIIAIRGGEHLRVDPPWLNWGIVVYCLFISFVLISVPIRKFLDIPIVRDFYGKE